jgi:hypothetical protein
VTIGGVIASVVVAVIAVGISIYTWRVTRASTSYGDLDRLCIELLKVGIQYPRLRQPDFTRDYKNRFEGEELTRYETYAYIAWNLCETIHDRCKGVEDVLNTWIPVIVGENKLHRRWFDNPENFHLFREEFRRYVQATYPKEY